MSYSAFENYELRTTLSRWFAGAATVCGIVVVGHYIFMLASGEVGFASVAGITPGQILESMDPISHAAIVIAILTFAGALHLGWRAPGDDWTRLLSITLGFVAVLIVELSLAGAAAMTPMPVRLVSPVVWEPVVPLALLVGAGLVAPGLRHARAVKQVVDDHWVSGSS